MPRRTNPKQAIVYYVRQHYASEEATVTESMMLVDAVTGDEAEVDVVIEDVVSAEPVTISIEVTGASRKAGLPWVRELIEKHRNLPTTKLVLVSWSGFSGPALRKVAQYPGSVAAVEPRVVVDADGHPKVASLFVDEFKMSPIRWSVFVACKGGVKTRIDDCPADAPVFLNGQEVSSVAELIQAVLHHPSTGERFGVLAHNDPQRSERTHFSFGAEPPALEPLGLSVRPPSLADRCTIDGLSVVGTFDFKQSQLDLRTMRMGDLAFATGEVDLAGSATIWVASPGPEESKATISWRGG